MNLAIVVYIYIYIYGCVNSIWHAQFSLRWHCPPYTVCTKDQTTSVSIWLSELPQIANRETTLSGPRLPKHQTSTKMFNALTSNWIGYAHTIAQSSLIYNFRMLNDVCVCVCVNKHCLFRKEEIHIYIVHQMQRIQFWFARTTTILSPKKSSQ